MERVCGVMGNRDLEPFIPALVSCIVRPAEVPDIVGKLSATTFVQTIEAPALAVMVPLLVRARLKSLEPCHIAVAEKRLQTAVVGALLRLLNAVADV